MWAVVKALDVFYQTLTYLILGRVIISWFIRDPYNRLYMILFQLTEPILLPCRRLTSKFGIGYGLDFSPIIALLLLNFTYSVLRQILFNLI